MPTAPSFKDYKRLSEPFAKNGKMYIKVEHPNTHNARDVRWYTDAEFAKNYGKQEKKDDGWDGLKHARGFDNGPILVIRNVRGPADEEWCKASCARYAVGIGWHIVSTDEFPADAPEHFKYVLLGWNEFRLGDDRHMKDPNALAAIISAKCRKGEYVDMKGGVA